MVDINFKKENKEEKSDKKNPLISDKTIELLNYRIEQEDLSSRVYLAIYLSLENTGHQSAKLWKKYSSEEANHADWARTYLLSLGITPKTPTLKETTCDCKNLVDAIQKTYEHELEVTKQCKELAAHAMSEGDHLLYPLTMRYMSEQIEEMDKAQTLLDQLESFGTDKIALRLLDIELSK